MHPAGVARIALLIGRVWRLSRHGDHGGAPGERQHDQKRGEPSIPVHPFLRPRPISRSIPVPTMATGRRLGSRKVTLLSNPSSIPIASASRMNSTRSKRRRRHNRDQIIAETVACLIRSVPVIDPAPIPFTTAGVAACFCPNVPSRGRKTSGRLHERHLPRSGPFGRVCVRWRATQIAVLDDWHNGLRATPS